MATYTSGHVKIHIDQHEPKGERLKPALIVLHGSGGFASYWLDRFGPLLNGFGAAVYAPHYFEKTGTVRATAEMILDGKHFVAWLNAVQDAVTYVASIPNIDPKRIGVLGVSLGGYLAVGLAIEDSRIRTVVELSGGVPLGWESRITPAMPPTQILHGDADQVVPVSEARKLEGLLKARGVAHEVDLLPGETHWFSSGAQTRLLMKAAGFLGRHL